MTVADFAEQIDRIAEKNEWFTPSDGGPFYAIIKSYCVGSIQLKEAVAAIVEPINRSYTSADDGKAIHYAEFNAANQRTFYSLAKAEELWGRPLPEDELPPVVDKRSNSTEMQLWNLWYSVLYTAKITPWEQGQERLLVLVMALKDTQDPAPPVQMTQALRHNWIWRTGKLWSVLSLMGPSVRETMCEALTLHAETVEEIEIPA